MDEHRSSDGSVDRASAIVKKSERKPGYAGPTPADLARTRSKRSRAARAPVDRQLLTESRGPVHRM